MSSTYFHGASDFNITNLSINGYYPRPDYWKGLVKKVALDALFDAKTSCGRRRCDEGTRVALNQETMEWMQNKESPTQLRCMTGPAGAGKSSIQQTIAEECARLKILAACFFFFTTEETRNNVHPVVPTIAYQLGLLSPVLREAITDAIAQDDAVFTKNLETQINTLIVQPFLQSEDQLGEFPYAILIDGVDECEGEADQVELLNAISRTLLNPKFRLPFRIFMATRPEPAIVTTVLRPTGALYTISNHITLNDQSDEDSGIRQYLVKSLREIADNSSDPRAKHGSWPRNEDIDTLVDSASGQFIVIATVIRYVSDPRSGGPVERLRTVMECIEGSARSSNRHPFATLDDLYYKILSKARDNYLAAAEHDRDFVLILRSHYFLVNKYAWDKKKANAFLGLSNGKLATLVYDLQSLLEVDSSESLRYHHKSFLDFLNNHHRSKDLYRSEKQVDILVRYLAVFQTLDFLTLGYLSETCYCLTP